MREALKGWGRRLARPQRQAGALTADVLAVIWLTAPKPRGRGFETADQAAERARFDLAMVAALTWGDVQRWDGSGRITVIRSKTDALAQGAVVAITPVAMRALDAIRPAGVDVKQKVFGLSKSQIACRMKAIAKAAGLANWEDFSGHSGRVGMARPHGPKRRALPRDRTPRPLETGRRHGRPLHPRRIGRVGPAVSVAAIRSKRLLSRVFMPQSKDNRAYCPALTTMLGRLSGLTDAGAPMQMPSP